MVKWTFKTKYVHIQNLWSNGPSKLSMYTYKTYGQMDLQTKYVHVQIFLVKWTFKLSTYTYKTYGQMDLQTRCGQW
jgi:hypothetical protein